MIQLLLPIDIPQLNPFSAHYVPTPEPHGVSTWVGLMPARNESEWETVFPEAYREDFAWC